MTLDLSSISKLETVARDVHQNAVDKGWWPLTPEGKADWGKRNVGEILILATSELAEALEIWRDGKNLVESWKGEKGKPEGYPIEMADAVIRVIETMIACNSPFEAVFKIAIGGDAVFDGLATVNVHRKVVPTQNVGEELMFMSSALADAFNHTLALDFLPEHDFKRIYLNGNAVKGFSMPLAHVVCMAFRQADRIGFDLWKAIEEKHAYNKTRPVRHGGKLA